MSSKTERIAGAPALSPEAALEPADRSLTSGGLLARNVIWNALGESGPLLAALVAMPILIRSLGTARFGVIALTWMLFGYFGLFDLGMGRAVTKLVSDRLGDGRVGEVPRLICTAVALTLGFGFAGGLLLFALSPWAVHSVLKVPAGLQPETLGAFWLMAVSLPIVVATGALRGVLAAFQRFDLLNAVRGPLGMFSFLGPLLVLPFSRSLVAIAAVLVVGRVIGCASHLIQCTVVVPDLRTRGRIDRSMAPALLTFGGWMTVTNIISPLMTHMDRLLLGALVSMEAIAYYATPYEMVTKLWLVPWTLMGVLFPAFAHALSRDSKRAVMLFNRGLKLVLVLLFPAVLIVYVFAGEILALWLGADFASHGATALRWLAVGVLINSVAQAPFALIQALDRPDITAKLHMIEFPLYLALAWWMITTRGVSGAAIAWTARATADALILFVLAEHLMPDVSVDSRLPGWMTLAGVASILLCALPTGIFARLILVAVILSLFVAVAWRSLLERDERTLLKSYFGAWS